MTDDLVSVIIPVYNSQEYLAAAIDSVVAQSYSHLEIIVVDDGSTDGGAQVAQSYSQVRYEHQLHSGQAAARNRGVALSRGHYIAFLDADDLWVEDKLVKQMDVFTACPDMDMVLGHAIEFGATPPSPSEPGRHQVAPRAQPCHLPGALLITRTAFDRVGPFATEWRVGEVVDWYARATEAALNIVVLPDLVLKRRIHDENLGRREQAAQTDYVRVLKRALDRRRAQGHSLEEAPDRPFADPEPAP